jgi:hypothetical protein
MTVKRPAVLDGLLDYVAARLPVDDTTPVVSERIPLDVPECSATCRCRTDKETGQ